MDQKRAINRRVRDPRRAVENYRRGITGFLGIEPGPITTACYAASVGMPTFTITGVMDSAMDTP